jgi:hypothetical protein
MKQKRQKDELPQALEGKIEKALIPFKQKIFPMIVMKIKRAMNPKYHL